MPLWLVMLALSAALWSAGCGWFGGGSTGAVADQVLRLVVQNEDGEIETIEGELPRGLREALSSAAEPGQSIDLPVPPQSTLRGSVRLAHADGRLTFFVLYDVQGGERATSEAISGLINETPWKLVSGQSGNDFSSFGFQSTRTDGIRGTVQIQPPPTSGTVEIVIDRDGKEQKIAQRRLAYAAVLGVQIENRDGSAVVTRVVPGVADGLREGDRIVRVGGTAVADAVGVQAALRQAGVSSKTQTSVMYIVQVVPDAPLTPPFVLPEPRVLPRDFPAPFLIVNGLTPVAVQWSTGSAGATYSVVLLTQQQPTEVIGAYRQALQAQSLRVTSDQAQGFATELEYESADGVLGGSITVDLFESDDAYTVVSLEVRLVRGGAPARPGLRPGAPPASPTATGTPSTGGTPSATATVTATPAR